MVSRSEKVKAFRELHLRGCFVIPNPWDAGSAQIMAGVGFKALATTSSGYAFSRGRKDGDFGRDETLAYSGEIARAVDVPVNADTEDCFAETAAGVAETVRLAAEAGLAGLSIEDRQPGGGPPIRGFDDAVARVAVAVEAARRHDIVLTARADGMLHRAYDLAEAIRRLQAFEKLGAEVLYAPAMPDLAALRALCGAVRAPVNHLIGAGASGLGMAEIAGTGVRRISLGGALARASGGALAAICREIAGGSFARLDAAPSWAALRGAGR
jgi:2-methylisocitrate lyase-like PEP mutase family enzyme